MNRITQPACHKIRLQSRQRVCSTSSSLVIFLSRSLGIPWRHKIITTRCRLTLKKWGFHRRAWRPGRPESQGTPSPSNELTSRAQQTEWLTSSAILALLIPEKMRRTKGEFDLFCTSEDNYGDYEVLAFAGQIMQWCKFWEIFSQQNCWKLFYVRSP